jgi:hypothetical protein
VTSHSPYYIYRRLAADARKVNLGPDTDVHPPKTGMKDVRKLLHAMGFDISAIHAATRVEVIIDDLDKRKDGWLHDAAKRAAEWVTEDYKAWQKHLLKKAAK